jgi:hypothetical protein
LTISKNSLELNYKRKSLVTILPIMKNNFFKILLVSTLIIFPFLANFAQAANLEDCFKYYDYAKVKVFLNPTKSSTYSTGDTVELIGQIENNNKFPIINANLFAHLKRVNEDKESFNQNGHYLIKKFNLAENLNLLPGEAKKFTFELPLEENLLTGKYQINYFIFTPDGFHYSGRPFLEEDVAGYSNFEVVNPENNQLFYFDIDNLTINQNPQPIKKDPFNIFKEKALNFSVPLVNSNDLPNVDAVARLYRFEDTFQELLIEEQKIDVSQNLASADFNFLKNGAYVVEFAISKPIPTMTKFRFTIESEDLPNDLALRINDLNVNSYPLNDTKAYVCFHSPLGSSDTNETNLSLQILDENQNMVDEIKMTDQFPPEVLALSLNTNKIPNKQNFYLKAKVEDLNNPKQSYEKIVHFNAESFANAVSTLSLSLDGDKLALKAQNVLGKEISNTLINQFLVYQNETNTIFEEKYRIKQLPYYFSISNLKPGNYQAKATAGNRIKVFDFSIDENLNVTFDENKINSNQTLSYIIAVGALIILFVLLIVLTKKDKKQK